MTAESWSSGPRKAVEEPLGMRGGDLAPPGADRAALSPSSPNEDVVAITGRFRKVRVKPIKRYGAYRGSGSLRLDERGLDVVGKHVRPAGTRVAIALGIVVATLILSAGRLVLGLIPIYLLVEYVLLEEGKRTIPWSSVARYSANGRKKLIAVETDEGEGHINPLVLRSDEWREALEGLRAYCAAREVEHEPPQSGRGRRTAGRGGRATRAPDLTSEMRPLDVDGSDTGSDAGGEAGGRDGQETRLPRVEAESPRDHWIYPALAGAGFMLLLGMAVLTAYQMGKQGTTEPAQAVSTVTTGLPTPEASSGALSGGVEPEETDDPYRAFIEQRLAELGLSTTETPPVEQAEVDATFFEAAVGQRLDFRVVWFGDGTPECVNHAFPAHGNGTAVVAYFSDCSGWRGFDLYLYAVEIRNVTDRPLPFALRNFVVVADTGASYGPVNVRDKAKKPQAFLPETGTLLPHASLEGFLTFDARVDFVPARLSYVDPEGQVLTVNFLGPHEIMG